MNQIIIQIFIISFGVLVTAIITNILANLLGLETWYSFIIEIQKNGFLKPLKEKWLHLFFLMIIYPFILGLVAYYLFKFLNIK